VIAGAVMLPMAGNALRGPRRFSARIEQEAPRKLLGRRAERHREDHPDPDPDRPPQRHDGNVCIAAGTRNPGWSPLRLSEIHHLRRSSQRCAYHRSNRARSQGLPFQRA
jgi:hypothetical protein